MTHPIRLLRDLLKSDPRTRDFATQEGFADLVDCSAGLIRRIEQGSLPVSPKLAGKIEGRLGIKRLWVYGGHPSNVPISNLDQPATIDWIFKHLEGGQHRRESQNPEQFSSAAEFLGEWVKRAVSGPTSQNDMTLFNRIVQVLNEDSLRTAGAEKDEAKSRAVRRTGKSRKKPQRHK